MRLDHADLAKRIERGDRRALARAITLVESSRIDHRAQADDLMERLGAPARSLRIGLSGPPGAGKSTFIESLGPALIKKGHRIAVLAIDPSSVVGGGSILGDKTRMERLSLHADAFIRPTPANTGFGGVARRTPEVIRVVEAAGFDIVIVETVGVGQSEVAVASMSDLFVLLLSPGAGDELQGIKRGIVELADMIFVNKDDGNLAADAARTAADYRKALSLFIGKSEGWPVEVHRCSALTGHGIDDAVDCILRYRRWYEASGALDKRRFEQARAWLWSEITEQLRERVETRPGLGDIVESSERAIASDRISAAAAAKRVIERYFESTMTNEGDER
ncbi:methylmalonyl Co-A mutase-associated GTPase MeaB [Thioalkalivibrio sp. HK1]|uniref:methylmalonyl Co-A mutase-associated GTPase MeaB n=1 Tax=Thioalkalivibrio sp. HK1 TaxID=1469245 RepID=UPI000470FE98|nr:methylmalonyl Co-A mutase-associated GTPase MeaB [Thioalkalivibrio sp. HK1]